MDVARLGAKFMTAALIAGAIGMWAVSAMANYSYGSTFLGAASEWRHVFGGASVVSDVVKAGIGLALIIAWRRGAYVAILACLVVWIVTAGWSAISASGFVATALSDSLSQREVAASRTTSKQLEIEQLLAALADARKEALHAKMRRDREAATEQVQAYQARLDWMRGEVRVDDAVGAPNPIGRMAETWLGVDKEAVKLTVVISFMALTELVSGLAFLAIAPYLAEHWGRQRPPPPPRDKPARPAARPAPIAAAPSTDIGRSNRAHAQAFLAELIQRGHGGKVIAKPELRDMYADWCVQQPDGCLAPTTLGAQLKALGVVDGGRYGGTRTYRIPALAVAVSHG